MLFSVMMTEDSAPILGLASAPSVIVLATRGGNTEPQLALQVQADGGVREAET